MKKEKKGKKRIPEPLKDKDWSGGCAISVPVFKHAVCLFVGTKDGYIRYRRNSCETNQELIDLCRYIEGEWPRPGEGMMVAPIGMPEILMPCLDATNEEHMATLYHEALHAALFIINKIGAKVGEDGEVLAYLQGYIVKHLLHELREGRHGTLLPDGTLIDC